MGRSVIEYYNNRYKGSLSDETCDFLEQTIKNDEEGALDITLQHCITNMSDSDVDDFIQDYEMFGQPMREYNKGIGTLRSYQTMGVTFAYYAKNFILGDSVGLGKTVEMAGLVQLLKAEYAQNNKNFRYLVLTEKNLAPQFRSEMVKFTGDFTSLISSGEARVLDNFINNNPIDKPLAYSVVGTHALFSTAKFIAWLEQCRTCTRKFPFDLLIVDESSCLSGSGKNGIVSGYKAIAKYFKRIIFLNATPFEDNLLKFYNQLNLLDSKMLPTKENFQKEYCVMRWTGMYQKPTNKYKNQKKFKELVKYFYFARTRRDNGAVMEDCDGGIVYSPLSPIQKEWLKKSQLKRVVYDCPNSLDSSIVFCSENVPKLGSLDNLLKTKCEDVDSILIFTWLKQAQSSLSEWLRNKGYSNRVLNGDTKNADREEIIKGFKNKEYKILITNVQKGLNFGDCNFCIFYSFDPNPSKMVQFEGRTTRSFDIINKNVYILCSKGEEAKQLNNVVKLRARSAKEFTNTDMSVVLSVLGGEFDEADSED